MDWIMSQSNIEPFEIDDTSSRVYVYVHKDIEEITADDGKVIYKYKEKKVKKDDWKLYKSIMDNTSAIDDLIESQADLLYEVSNNELNTEGEVK